MSNSFRKMQAPLVASLVLAAMLLGYGMAQGDQAASVPTTPPSPTNPIITNTVAVPTPDIPQFRSSPSKICTELMYTPRTSSGAQIVDWRPQDASACYATVFAKPNSVVAFKWGSSYGRPGPLDVKQIAADDCNAPVIYDHSGPLKTAGFAAVTFPQPGQYFFAASVPGKCASSNMKVKVVVRA